MSAAGWTFLVLITRMTSAQPPTALARVDAGALDVTEGAVRARPGGFTSGSAKLRAVAPGFHGAVELRFQYLGPTAETAPLASGEMRRQLGLKLNAQDGCNLVYVMWRIAPVPSLVVQVKENPGQRLHGECGNRGYRTVRPTSARPPLALARALAPGEKHTLRAELSGRQLSVWADGALAWAGPVADGPLPFDGPVGLRADNARLDAELWARPEPKRSP